MQNNLANPDIGQNKFLKSPNQQADMNYSYKKDESRERMHHFDIMRLLNSVENVNIESNLPKFKDDDGLQMLMELENKKRERYQKTVFMSLADNRYYWMANSNMSEPRSPVLTNFDLPKLQKGSGSFVGSRRFTRCRIPSM